MASLLQACVAPSTMAPRETVDYTIPDGPTLSLLSKSGDSYRYQVNTLYDNITNYQVVREFYVMRSDGRYGDISPHLHSLPSDTVIGVIRRFQHGTEEKALAVNASTLETYLIDPRILEGHGRPARRSEVSRTRLHKMLDHSRDHVVDRVHPRATDKPAFSFILTVDMCQSTRPWDRTFFEKMIDLPHTTNLSRPTEIGIAITGKWALWHPQGFQTLKSWARDNKLSITWINHSMNHPLRRNRQGEYLFLTDTAVDFDNDVLSLEILMLQNGITPSIWFRFPGLVYNARTLAALNDLSLLPLDASAWLAKTRTFGDGAVVLVHGNGNEPIGLRYFEAQLDRHKTDLQNGDLEMLPVANAALEAPTVKFNVASRDP